MISSYCGVQLPGRLQQVPGVRSLPITHGPSPLCYYEHDRGGPESPVSRVEHKSTVILLTHIPIDVFHLF